MAWFEFIWTQYRVDKLAQHGLTPDDFEAAFAEYFDEEPSESSGNLIRFGYTADGRTIAMIFQWIEKDLSVIPITA